jgi:hypothetical protein
MEDRQDFAEDNWDDHHHGYYDNDGEVLAGVLIGAAVVGAAASTTTTYYITVLPCSAPAVIVNGVSYYNCSSSWYQRGYAGSQVTYVIGGPPPGY